jgi:D-amino-acid dehydrogenase
LAVGCGNEFGLVRRGLLALCKSQHALEEEGHAAEEARRLGVPTEVLDSREVAKLDPGARMDVVGAVYFPKDCHLTPQRFMARLKNLAVDLGVKFHWQSEVTGVRAEDNRLRALVTKDGNFSADEYVLAGGSWSAGFGRDLGLRLPMQPGKGYSITLENPPALPTICSILVEARVAVTPMQNTVRVGGTMEMAGLNEEINRVRVAGITKAMTRYYPEFQPQHFENQKVWRGLRPVSPDGLPYLGRTKRYSNLLVATGHAMMGLSLGPISGKIVAQILAEEKPTIDTTLLNPDRYA